MRSPPHVLHTHGTPKALRAVSLVLGLAAALSTSACSLVLDSDRHRSDAEPVPATAFCAELASVYCTALRDCCARPAVDFDACTQQASIDCAGDFGALGIDPRTGYDDAQAGLALAEARALLDTCDTALYAWNSSPLGFQRALAGTVPYGGSCAPGLLEAGALLSCADDGMCSLVDAEWTCVAPVPRGEECTFDAACEPGLRCSVNVPLLTTGACQPRKGVGASCNRASECETHLCDRTCREATVDEAFCPR